MAAHAALKTKIDDPEEKDSHVNADPEDEDVATEINAAQMKFNMKVFRETQCNF